MKQEPEITLQSLDDTQALAKGLAQAFPAPAVLAIDGTLGAGKTQLIRYFAEQLGVNSEDVTSPTYVLQQLYRGSSPIHHFDFYRLENAAQVWDLGIDELFEQDVVVLIEWASKYTQCLPEERLDIRISVDATGSRIVQLTAHGRRHQANLDEFERGRSATK